MKHDALSRAKYFFDFFRKAQEKSDFKDTGISMVFCEELIDFNGVDDVV